MTPAQQANVDFALGLLTSLVPVAGLGVNATAALSLITSAATAIKNAQAAGTDVSDADLQALFDQFARNDAADQIAQMNAAGNTQVNQTVAAAIVAGPAVVAAEPLAGDSTDKSGHGGPTLGGMVPKNPDLDPSTGLPFVAAQGSAP